MLCTEKSLVKVEPGLLRVHPLRCRCWSCSHCAPWRAAQLRQQARQGAPNIFLTLTIRKGQFASPDAQAVELAKGWRMLRQWLMRTYQLKSLPFLIVFEKHKSGWPHAHVLIRSKYLDHKLIRAWWEARFASPQIWIEAVNSQQKAAVYVSKYMSKAPHVFAGCKRYWRSQDYILPEHKRAKLPKDPGVYWTTVASPVKAVLRMAYFDGARITMRGAAIEVEGWSERDRSRWGIG